MDSVQPDFINGILSVLSGGLKVLWVVLIFSVLVVGHEFGHFIAAKLTGMRVDEFAIGFGKKLFSWTKGETLYSVNLVPLGGYNKIYGMDVEDDEETPADTDKASVSDAESSDDKSEQASGKPAVPAYQPPDYSVAPKDDPRAYVNRPLWARFLVVISGPLANIVIAVLIIFIMGITIGFPAAELGGVIPGGPADRAGLQKNDIITHLNGIRLSSTNDLHHAIILSDGEPLELKGWRDNEMFTTTVIPQTISSADSYFCRLGFVYLSDGTILSVLPESAAEHAGLRPRDLLINIDGFAFPTHDLEITEPAGSLNVDVYREYEILPLEIEYTENDVNNFLYNPFGFFFNRNVDVWDFEPESETVAFDCINDFTQEGIFSWVLEGPDGIVDYDFNVDQEINVTWDELMAGETYQLMFIESEGSEFNYAYTLNDEPPVAENKLASASTVITHIIPGSIASEAGLITTDIITGGETINWRETIDSEETYQADPLTVEYVRDGDTRIAKLEPDPGYSRIQVLMDDAADPVLVNLPYNHRLAQAGLASGDEIMSIDGVPTPNGISAFLEFQKHFGSTIDLVAMSGDNERVFTVPVPDEESPEELDDFFAGLHFKTNYYSSDPVSSFMAGINKSKSISDFIFMTLSWLISGQASISDLAGPVGIVSITYQAASNGFVDLINIMVLLSINLAIFNLLPFPALDGGRILFMIPELFIGKPIVNVRVENLVHIFGFLLLIIFALFVTYHDIVRLFVGD